MALGKCATGLWLIVPPAAYRIIDKIGMSHPPGNVEHPNGSTDCHSSIPANLASSPVVAPSGDAITPSDVETPQLSADREGQKSSDSAPSTSNRGSIQAALLLSVAMTTRGEIGFLIAAVGQSHDILVPDEIYLIVIWAIVLCTLAGPVGVGIIARRLKNTNDAQRRHILGIWA